jgi:hypothetical protein
VVDSNFIPQPVCEIGVELSVGMEPVAGFDHFMRITALHHLSL